VIDGQCDFHMQQKFVCRTRRRSRLRCRPGAANFVATFNDRGIERGEFRRYKCTELTTIPLLHGFINTAVTTVIQTHQMT
jgi:hypothetical protein